MTRRKDQIGLRPVGRPALDAVDECAMVEAQAEASGKSINYILNGTNTLTLKGYYEDDQRIYYTRGSALKSRYYRQKSRLFDAAIDPEMRGKHAATPGEQARFEFMRTLYLDMFKRGDKGQ